MGPEKQAQGRPAGRIRAGHFIMAIHSIEGLPYIEAV
jgi:hypothetical protein